MYPKQLYIGSYKLLWILELFMLLKKKKVKSVSEKYYALKDDGARIGAEEWKKHRNSRNLIMLLTTIYHFYINIKIILKN